MRSTILAVLSLSALLAMPLFGARAAGAPQGNERLGQLARQFAESESPAERKRAAAVALRAAEAEDLSPEQEGEMRELLLTSARASATAQTPFPFLIDADGAMVLPAEVTAEFAAWASAQGMEIDAAVEMAIWEQPGDVSHLLGHTTPEAIAVFQEALSSPNHFVAANGAYGLGLADDAASVEEVVELAETVPTGLDILVAAALDLFSDPTAKEKAAQILAVYE